MSKFMQRLGLASFLAVFLSFTLNATPAFAAYADYGVNEDKRCWVDTAPSPDTTYCFHLRFKLSEDEAASPDRWRFTLRAWCTKQPSGGSETFTTCNFDLFTMGMWNCNPGGCGYPIPDTNYSNEYLFRTDSGFYKYKECDGVTECVYTMPSVTQDPNPYNYFIATIAGAQAKFLLPEPNHPTQVYGFCSKGVTYGSHGIGTANKCDDMVPM